MHDVEPEEQHLLQEVLAILQEMQMEVVEASRVAWGA